MQVEDLLYIECQIGLELPKKDLVLLVKWETYQVVDNTQSI